MSDTIIHLNDNNFEKNVLQVNGLFLVDFWANWCTPCKTILPILAEIADEFQNKLTITKLNIDENPVTTLKYGIRSIPTLLLFRNGEVVATKIGAVSKGELRNFLNINI